MTNLAFAPAAGPARFPCASFSPGPIFAGLLAFVALYFVGVEEGAISHLHRHVRARIRA